MSERRSSFISEIAKNQSDIDGFAERKSKLTERVADKEKFKVSATKAKAFTVSRGSTRRADLKRLDKLDNKIEKVEKQQQGLQDNSKRITHIEKLSAINENRGMDKIQNDSFVSKARKKNKGKTDKAESKLKANSAQRENILEHSGTKKHYEAKKTLTLAENNLAEKRIEIKKVKKKGGNYKALKAGKTDLKLEKDAAKADLALIKAESKLPTQKVKRFTYHCDEKTGLITKKKIVVEEIKPMDGNGGIVTKSLKGTAEAAALAANPWTIAKGEIGKYESENATLKVAMTGVRTTERGLRHGAKLLKQEPHRRVAKLQHKADKANAKIYANRKGGTAFQKQQLKKQYMKKAANARRAVTKETITTKALALLKAPLKAIAHFITKNPTVILIIIAVILIFILIYGIITMIMLPFTSAGGDLIGGLISTYPSEDADIHKAYDELKTLYTADIASNESGSYDIICYYVGGQPKTQWQMYNEYIFDPHQLISYLSAYWLVYVNGVSIDSDDYKEDITPFHFNTTRASNMVKRKVKDYYEAVYSVSSTTTTEYVTTQYLAGVWEEGHDLLKVDDVIYVPNCEITIEVEAADEDSEPPEPIVITGNLSFLVTGVEIIEHDNGWNAEYTVEIIGHLDGEGNQLTTTLFASDLYAVIFSRTREMTVRNIYFNTLLDNNGFAEYIQSNYNEEMRWVFEIMYEEKGNREPGLFMTQAEWNAYVASFG